MIRQAVSRRPRQAAARVIGPRARDAESNAWKSRCSGIFRQSFFAAFVPGMNDAIGAGSITAPLRGFARA